MQRQGRTRNAGIDSTKKRLKTQCQELRYGTASHQVLLRGRSCNGWRTLKMKNTSPNKETTQTDQAELIIDPSI